MPRPPAVSFNLAEHVLAAGAAMPDRVALCVLGPSRADRWSYGRLISAVRGTATGLLEAGLVPGDRVLMRLGDTPGFPVAFLGAIAAGLVPVPTSAALTVPEITAIAADLAPAAVLAGEGPALPDHPAPVLAGETLRTMAALPPAPWHRGDPERPGYIVYTSGTSGRPRGVVYAHRAILARAAMHAGWTGLLPSDRLLHAGAFNWTFTLGTGLLDPWTLGATALIPAAGSAPDLLPLLLRRHDATIFAAAPGVFRRMLRQPLPTLPTLRHGLSAGEKLPETIRRAWATATGTALHEAYGLSECSTFVSGSPLRPAPPGTLGFPQQGRRTALRSGQIAVHRGDPGLMLGYLNAPEETAARFDGDWFLTGDLARETEEGALIYEGRADDMLNAGGLRVSPLEIETAMEAHPGIEEAAACDLRPRPDTTVIGLFYTGTPLDEATLAAHAATRLARYKHPRLYIHRETLPRSANGKLQRRTLRTHWEADHGQA
ncbi:class I adenylate-forming enzyme family protein [Histidinibacterium lentulum]|uniref:Long-chain fatty acid--CoA ligase n=1 Tax=Histidinibacterium lentulum TaxID=2480588 RepID=A0A3N2R9C9_9RHOB|nr:class I adenylate-forming enzyme family protein [Histidinibacterium lentulum]ROU03981.1 long-chain fatty acid--CoA ligase [Histidinibacterium lentulum]